MARAKLYQYPGCSTCKKAAKWLSEHDVTHDSVHLVEQTPDAKTLRKLWQDSGLPLKKFFNTAGNSYRQGDFKSRLPSMSEEAQIEALTSDGMLIKRPILSVGKAVRVGFREAEWRDALGL